MSEARENIAEKRLTRGEAEFILKFCGVKLRHFFLNTKGLISRATFYAKVDRAPMPLLMFDFLRDYVGAENFEIARKSYKDKFSNSEKKR